MNTQSQNGYMLLFRGNDWLKSLSPEEKQKVTDQWMAWFRRLTDQGKAVAGNPLEREGKIVSGKNRVVSDGPFAESKEAIGGYFCSMLPAWTRRWRSLRNAPVCRTARAWKSDPWPANVPLQQTSEQKRSSRKCDSALDNLGKVKA